MQLWQLSKGPGACLDSLVKYVLGAQYAIGSGSARKAPGSDRETDRLKVSAPSDCTRSFAMPLDLHET